MAAAVTTSVLNMAWPKHNNIGAGDAYKTEVAEQMEVDVDEPNNADIHTTSDQITCLEFSHNGELLAAGAKNGRITVLRRKKDMDASTGVRTNKYKPGLTFKSHKPEFDYLKSIEIEGKVNQIKFLKKPNAADFLLSSNEKTIKMWKIAVNRKGTYKDGFDQSNISLTLPSFTQSGTGSKAKLCRTYSNGHVYHINSLSVNSDQETFLSADDLRINLWHQEVSNQSFNIVDKKPQRMEELKEVITKAEFHPFSCNLFAYASSQGIVRVCDMRNSAILDKDGKVFVANDESPKKLKGLLAGISDIRFSHSGRYFSTRDFLTVKVWDMNMETAPVETYRVHDYVTSKLCDLYENESIYDKFECSWSADDREIATGSYNSFFRTFKRNSPDESTIYEAGACCRPVHHSSTMLRTRKTEAPPGKKRRDEMQVDSLDCGKKILHCSWHPNSNSIALASTNSLYVFGGL